jgi:ASC-1-like (ASCH) protein
LEIFKENVKKIDAHNEKFKTGEVSWSQGINHFTDLKPEERQNYFGVVPPNN